MPTPQEKIDAIQAKVNEQNRQRALQNVANVQNNTLLQDPKINQIAPSTGGVTPLPNVYNPATATP